MVNDGAVRAVPVTVGAPLGGSLELIDGPPTGTKIVSAPPAELVDGMKIKEKGS